MLCIVFVTGLIFLAVPLLAAQKGSATAPDDLIEFTEDGGWCWFEDPRALIHDGKLIIGVVSSGYLDPEQKGDIRSVIYEIQTGERSSIELFDQLQLDDHDSPVFLGLPDGSVLTLFAQHGDENLFYYRISEPGDPTRWGSVNQFIPSESTSLTYSNPHLLTGEKNRIYNFFRGLDNSFKPSYVYSDDLGRTWTTGNVFIDVPSEFRHRPYVRYVSDGVKTVHMIYTEGHPRNYDNSIYHIYYRDGSLHQSNGSRIASLSEGLSRPELGTLVFKGDADHVAWTVDIELDKQGRPFTAYSVQVGSAGLPSQQGGEDHRYRFAYWDGERWHDSQMAYAGSRLYPREDDYTGLVALFPGNPRIAFISTDANPSTGEPLISQEDGKRHYEIFRGDRSSSGSWEWMPVTKDSTEDNLRPIIPKPSDGKTAVLWLRGDYRTYTDYSLKVVGIFLEDVQP
jgi:hypothetical protein